MEKEGTKNVGGYIMICAAMHMSFAWLKLLQWKDHSTRHPRVDNVSNDALEHGKTKFQALPALGLNALKREKI